MATSAARMSIRVAGLQRISTSTPIAAPKPFLALSASSSRPFHTTRARAAAKETEEGSEARKEAIEHAKQQQLREQKEGRGEWKQDLASESESITKADRGEMKASKENIRELQRESAEAAQREKKK